MSEFHLPVPISKGERAIFIPGPRPKLRDAVRDAEEMGESSNSVLVNTEEVRMRIAAVTELPRQLVRMRTEDMDMQYRLGIESDEVSRIDDYNEYHDPDYSEIIGYKVSAIPKLVVDGVAKSVVRVFSPQRAERLVIFDDINDVQKENEARKLSHWAVGWRVDAPEDYRTSFAMKYMANGLGQVWTKKLELRYSKAEDAGITDHQFANFGWDFLSYMHKQKDPRKPNKVSIGFSASNYSDVYEFTSKFGVIGELIKEIPLQRGNGGCLYTHPIIEFVLEGNPQMVITANKGHSSTFDMIYDFKPETGKFKRGKVYQHYADFVRKSKIIKNPELSMVDFDEILESALRFLTVSEVPTHVIESPDLPQVEIKG
jgi:hypothetical protein